MARYKKSDFEGKEIKTMGVAPRAFVYDPPQEPLNILYQDDDLLVLSKPSGLLSVPGKEETHYDSLEIRAKKQCPESLLVHRLDLDTSGIIVMAMNPMAQANLGKQFERRKIDKTYIACVHGLVEKEDGLVDLPLRCDWEFRPRQMVCHEFGKPSQTHWHVLDRENSGNTRIELTPITGRSHQLRVHMAQIGHPILGEPFYAPEDIYKAAPRLYLHAYRLKLYHPQDGRVMEFTDEAPF